MPGLGDYEKKEKGKRGFEMPMKEYGKGKSPIASPIARKLKTKEIGKFRHEKKMHKTTRAEHLADLEAGGLRAQYAMDQ